jgi:hypothetical protein
MATEGISFEKYLISIFRVRGCLIKSQKTKVHPNMRAKINNEKKPKAIANKYPHKHCRPASSNAGAKLRLYTLYRYTTINK